MIVRIKVVCHFKAGSCSFLRDKIGSMWKISCKNWLNKESKESDMWICGSDEHLLIILFEQPKGRGGVSVRLSCILFQKRRYSGKHRWNESLIPDIHSTEVLKI